ncbi:hypothetical protein M514_09055 [Trichuris suis]|uniref:BED-type domain-containing protein n=1 Tax=Trichuris suis TaxID=68888 RepID=A0A085LYP9_9BILA|nr:hypothetical protein M513_09055 [Trichuris suis]KFD59802.1 hypothetical protein M514_09055 [Trichuris suis]
MAQANKKCREYIGEYLRFGVAVSPGREHLPVCLLCERVLSNESMKPPRMKMHLMRRHPDKSNMDVSYSRALREKVMKKRTLNSMISSLSKPDRDGLAASYRISLLIAKAGKPHTIGEELIMPAIAEILEAVLHQNARDVTRKIPLSNHTVQRRIDAMAEDTEETLCCMLRQREFSLQLDESTLPGNESLLLAYVRFIKEEWFVEELLLSKELSSNTRGESIFQAVEEFFMEKAIPLQNVIAVATGGAPAMLGCQRGFISYLKDIVPMCCRSIACCIGSISSPAFE